MIEPARMKRLISLAVYGFTFLPLLHAQGAEHPKPAAENQADDKFPAPAAEETTVPSKHTITLNGRDIHYTATAGTLLLEKENGKPRASMFYVAYTVDGADPASRPITFAFNGGPGSSSVWLHMGALGPRRVTLSPEGMAVAPPYKIVDNQDTALAFTDLVFIDPVTTGFSRNAPGENPAQFHGLEGDLESVADFIRLFLTKSERWASPKYLAGESYGTTRASALAGYLIEHQGIYLNGITLISSVLNFQTLLFRPGNDAPYVFFLPSYTAAAWYHKKLPSDLQSQSLEEVTRQSREFAGGKYLEALHKGAALGASERTEIVQQLARFTGLPADYIERSDLRIKDQRFMKQLLLSDKQVIGRYDARLVGPDEDPVSDTADFDPSYTSVLGAFTAAFNQYIRQELKWKTDLPYEVLTAKVQPWNYSGFTNSFVDVSSRLVDGMTANPFMKILQMNGYFDLATPFFATEYTFDHLPISPQLRKNVTFGYCGAGHMLYLKEGCLDELHKKMGSIY